MYALTCFSNQKWIISVGFITYFKFYLILYEYINSVIGIKYIFRKDDQEVEVNTFLMFLINAYIY